MRASGILLHPTSLPGPWGVGTLGSEARNFLDFLQAAGQKYWQILPLNPTGYGNSPYQSFSAFAGNPYLISPELLEQEGLLVPGEAQAVQADRVDFGYLYETRFQLLRKAFSRFVPSEEFFRFCEENAHYLEDYALFMALKGEFLGAAWYQWPREIRLREKEVLSCYREKLAEELAFWRFVEFTFACQWEVLRGYAKERNIQIIGDVPIYVAPDSCDIWANTELFLLDEDCRPTQVAGCPPDFFSEEGQLWGNPLYNWEEMKKDGYGWWCARLAAAKRRYDTVRLDHFRGFESYWAVPAGEKTAKGGHWHPGPGLDFVEKVQAELPELTFIAEDLGFLTPEVHELRKAAGWPGMVILSFAFDSPGSAYLPHNHKENSVCYIGTHDNPTARQFLETGNPSSVAAATAYLGLSDGEGPVWGLIRGGMCSAAKLFIAQMQDYLELGAEGRMNAPGTDGDENWTWRALDGCFTPQLAEKIRKMTARYGRI